MADVYIRTIRHGRDTLVAVCDAEILGKTIDGGRVPFKVNEQFYKGALGSLREAMDAIKKATICNLVGKKIVEEAIDNNLVQRSAVIYFGDVPHAQIVIM